jgi:pyruvate/2-oxoglutarate dehydrogenase complex dihydrolipoamide dehydrogenase (E3) component
MARASRAAGCWWPRRRRSVPRWRPNSVGAVSAGPVALDAVEVDPLHRTSVPGVFAAGDLSAQMPQVAAAIAAGSLSAAAAVQSLLADDFALPVPPWPTKKKENADAHA